MDRENPTPQFNGGAANRSRKVPQEIVEEILTLLPVKSLLRFKCVSKSWHQLTGSDRFIKIHLKKSRDEKTFSHRRVIINYINVGSEQCSLRSYLDEPSVNPTPSTFEDPQKVYVPSTGYVVDTSNGVVCIFEERGSFVLFNPATRTYKLPPSPCRLNILCGFGWDETSDAYKVFGIFLDDHDKKIGLVYSTKTNSWKEVKHEFPSTHRDIQGMGTKFVCGKIHYLATDSGQDIRIESFDLKNEVFGVIELPCKPEGICLRKANGFLAVSRCREASDMWVMKEYGVEESWVKEAAIRPRRNIVFCLATHETHAYVESLVDLTRC